MSCHRLLALGSEAPAELRWADNELRLAGAQALGEQSCARGAEEHPELMAGGWRRRPRARRHAAGSKPGAVLGHGARREVGRRQTAHARELRRALAIQQ